jgi:hypothetical protein
VKLEAVSSLVGVDITLEIQNKFLMKTNNTEMSANHDFFKNKNLTGMPRRKLKKLQVSLLLLRDI